MNSSRHLPEYRPEILKFAKFAGALLCLVILFVYPFRSAFAAIQDPPVPPGFRLILSGTGVSLYQKNYPGGNPDFVQVVDLRLGASVRPLHGDVTDQREGQGVYGGDDPHITMQSLQSFWQQAVSLDKKAFCVTNGQFFYMKESPTRLPFPLKVDGTLVSTGYAARDYPGQKLMLELWPDHSDIQPLSKEALFGSSAPNIVAGLTEDARKSPTKYLARTFVGVADRDQDGVFETVLVFDTKSTRQADAADVLRAFGAGKVMMLDGGGSTQLSCRGEVYVDSDRPIPQALAINEGTLPPLSSEVLEVPGRPVLLTGEAVSLRVELKNTGSETWLPGSYQLDVRSQPDTMNDQIALTKDVATGESALFSWKTAPFAEPGVYVAQLYLTRNQQPFPGDPAQLMAVVIPKELESRRQDLIQKIDEWNTNDPAQLEQLVQGWTQSQFRLMTGQNSPAQAKLQAQAAPKAEQSDVLQPADILWIPLSMSPVVFFLFIVINKIRLKVE